MSAIRDKVEKALAQIDATAKTSHVFTVVYHERVRAEADAADARRRTGSSLGPLDGAIVSIKDLFDVAGEPTTAGSALLRTAEPAATDAPVIARLRRAGALIIGKTNMSEFAFSGLGLNPHYGTPGNAVDPTRVPGGSSSGAGVSVSEGTSEISIGSDTGGSVRIPAAFNGVTGFKPTAGRVSTEGAFPLSYTLDTIGPLAKTVQQCADTDAIMAGYAPQPVTAFPLAGLRVGVPRGLMFENVDSVVGAAFEAQLTRLSQLGAKVVDWQVDDLILAMRQATAPAAIAAVEAAAVHAPWLDTRGAEYDRRVLSRILGGRAVPAATFINTMRRRSELIAAMDARLTPLDVLLLPTVPTVAPEIAALEADDDLFGRINLQTLRNPMLGNLFELTGTSLPVKTSSLPVGLMLIGRRMTDARLLSVAKGVQDQLELH
ncbi:amidase [Bradyrhizobium sp. U87765 SZCCT0131]|uniref:amidase n=1 Tax=unclassified Bradyrhizobium TaxID=2631580 RepID=UPI001BA86D0C|nr:MULTISPECIES: amidase [unclassified Bradyrhizobium]MBR1218338.1 amidase [Bradyrhizobium sp. U87765 SZCCT0131]MBR1260716.1 amidase [Bradyrhizobium sp. U87765 SZCCT0134]MBR1303836.1 amidase [Bradyrhizobium sp. U87765 SZCCT0110]MBR1319442.1 amidase [Bradyrhizobium sp. U87765 SZCCT0109]MBR1347767.1 amidase [Bradyrhizobium sp. U87765 SZCCT0048]